MQLREFLEAVRRRAGSTESDARVASKKTLEVFGELLTRADREAVAEQLPRSLANALQRGEPGRDFDLDTFYERVVVDDGAEQGFQLEHAQAVCAALAELVDAEVRKRLQAHLPEEFRELLQPREIPELEQKPRRQDIEQNARKLSTGRPGGSRPLNEAKGAGHSNSVAKSDNPRGGRKLSTSSGAPNEGHDLATGSPPGEEE